MCVSLCGYAEQICVLLLAVRHRGLSASSYFMYIICTLYTYFYVEARAHASMFDILYSMLMFGMVFLINSRTIYKPNNSAKGGIPTIWCRDSV